MMLVVTYDVDTSNTAGQKRLRKVAKICERHGMRVQNSVFEVLVDAAQLVSLKNELKKAIDMTQDSVRFYRLGNSYENRIETMGKKPLVEAGSPLIF
ncbi:CRISPR-associated endonuclease Cas2 [Yeguia hominis]|uniref:CRISPR-associated endoribonuclease Cas2 n=1 Tax=Yeguia hominis TaxID=2763662 RepID=A0A926DAY3_9FIRM|nr:CRISPR-associated endonuclease Cas2 [Yeguia hominis]MBC8533625.1 CRISPR-associated endonuclease Cas2 [Yeguia hominis]